MSSNEQEEVVKKEDDSNTDSESDVDMDDALLADFEVQVDDFKSEHKPIGQLDLPKTSETPDVNDLKDQNNSNSSIPIKTLSDNNCTNEGMSGDNKTSNSESRENTNISPVTTEKCSDDAEVKSPESPSKTIKSEEESSAAAPETAAKDKCSNNDASQKLLQKKEDSEKLRVDLPPLKDSDIEVEGATANPLSDTKDQGNSGPSVYHVKWIDYRSKEVPIVTQNENGPCPLLAIMNVLLMKGKVKFSPNSEFITSDQLMTYLGDCILENRPKNVTEAVQLNYEQNMQDAMAVLHKLQTGLDVNVRFTGVQDFEYTPECIIFDLLGISLYHGWLVDPQEPKTVEAVSNCSYNQLVEKIISQRTSDKEEFVTEALLGESFLEKTASQLSYHGLCELSSSVKENELCVFFRNNHFSTMYRHQKELFLLVTDQGFLNEENVVWETLSNVEGDGYFVDANFHTYTKPAPEPVLPTTVGSEEQVDQDYLLAMSLQQEQQMSDEELAWNQTREQQQQLQMTDEELAARLQAEEDERAAHAAAEQQQRQQAPQPQQQGQRSAAAAQTSSGRRSRDRERDRDRDHDRDKSKDNCCIL